MPTYEYMCSECQTVFDEVRSIAGRNAVCCPKCGAMPPHVYQVFTTPRNVIPDMPEYYDRGMGKGDGGKGVHIRGRKHRRDEMRRRGLTEAGDSSLEKEAKELLSEHAERKRARP